MLLNNKIMISMVCKTKRKEKKKEEKPKYTCK